MLSVLSSGFCDTLYYTGISVDCWQKVREVSERMETLRSKKERTRSLGHNGESSEQEANTGNSEYKTAALRMTARFRV